MHHSRQNIVSKAKSEFSPNIWLALYNRSESNSQLSAP